METKKVRPMMFALAVFVGVLPACVAALLQWFLGAGVDQEIQGGLAYLVPVIAAWWMGVSAGVMIASDRARTLIAGVVVGAISVLPMVAVQVMAREVAERATAWASPAVWGTAVGAIAIPTGIGLLFADKQLARKR